MKRLLPKIKPKNRKKMDKVTVLRIDSQDDYTHGIMQFNGKTLCFTIEDESREEKVKGETRVPDCTLKLALRNSGGFNERYKKKFADMGADWHQGMLCLYNAGNWEIKLDSMTFQYVLIHIGNNDDHTAGCVLTGLTAELGKNNIGKSTDAYKKVYPVLRDAINNSSTGYIEIELKTIG